MWGNIVRRWGRAIKIDKAFMKLVNQTENQLEITNKQFWSSIAIDGADGGAVT